MFNKVFFEGRLTKDPDFRGLPSGTAVCNFTLAQNRKLKDEREETVFVNVRAWGKQAQYCRDSLAKGYLVIVEGSLRLEQWETADGRPAQRLVINAESVQIIGKRSDNSEPSEHSEEPSMPETNRGTYGF